MLFFFQLFSEGFKVVGYIVIFVGNEMFIIGGYDCILGFNERFYVYNIDIKKWKNLIISGFFFKGLCF